MKRYLSTTREHSRQISRRRGLRTILILGVVMLLLFYLIPGVVGVVASLLFAPVAQVETWLGDGGTGISRYFGDREALIEENTTQRKELDALLGSENTIHRLERENEELRALIAGTTTERIGASVIGRPTAMPYDVLVLDKGSRDGIEADAPVYIGTDQVIGYVARAYADSSVVVLATTPGFESTVYIYGPNIYTTAEGQGSGVLKVSVPQGIALEEGDLVVIPSFQGGVFGEIGFVESQPTDPEQRGYVTLQTPLQSIRLVSVGTSSLRPLRFEEATEIVSSVRRDIATVPVPSGILIDVVEDTGTSSATSTATSTVEIEENTL